MLFFVIFWLEYRENKYCRGPLTGPTRTGPMLLENEIIDILKNHVKPINLKIWSIDNIKSNSQAKINTEMLFLYN